MGRLLSFILLALIAMAGATSGSRAQEARPPDWQAAQAENLLHWLGRADDEAIFIRTAIMQDLRGAIDGGDQARLNQAAERAALRLLEAYRGRCCGVDLPANWHISRPAAGAELRASLATALAQDRLDLMLRANRPDHPVYRALAAAYADTSDAQGRENLARNLARWRSLPLPPDGRYLIVNVAAQELTLWDRDTPIDSWRVIIGKPSTKTPVFPAEVTGVVLNPWWDIPASIVAEGIGTFVRRNPSAARARGYVYSGGRYRQRPGDNNALGRMKLVMPNRFSVFLHDTSNRALFALEDRMLSHGCVRVDRALDFAALLLRDAGWTRGDINAAVAQGETQTVPLERPVPLFVAYFTAWPDAEGTVRQLPDIYLRDR